MAPKTEFYTATQVAELYATTADTVRRWARDGKIPVVTLPSGRMRFPRSDVDERLAAAGQVSA